MNNRQPNRREFNELCIVLGSSLAAASTMFALSSRASALDAIKDATPAGPGRRVKFPDGTTVPTLGQGSWHLAQGRHPDALEEEALRTGISLGMT